MLFRKKSLLHSSFIARSLQSAYESLLTFFSFLYAGVCRIFWCHRFDYPLRAVFQTAHLAHRANLVREHALYASLEHPPQKRELRVYYKIFVRHL